MKYPCVGIRSSNLEVRFERITRVKMTHLSLLHLQVEESSMDCMYCGKLCKTDELDRRMKFQVISTEHVELTVVSDNP